MPDMTTGNAATVLAQNSEAEAAKATVNTPGPGWERMEPARTKIDDVLAGTEHMRQLAHQSQTYLPRIDAEEPEDYTARVEMSVLHGGLARAVGQVSGKPFAKDVVLKGEGELAEPLNAIEDDVDGQGTNLTQFARQMVEDAASYGLAHFLVDHPTMPEGGRTREDFAEVRPRWLRVHPRNLIGWTWVKLPTGELKLTSIRMRERATKEVGDWGQIEVDRVRVWRAPFLTSQFDLLDEEGKKLVATAAENGDLDEQALTEMFTVFEHPGVWELHERVEGTDDFVMVERDTHTYPGVPLVTIYFKKTGFLEAKPPFETVCDLNIAHWQSASRGRFYLDFIRLGILFGKGLDQKQVDEGIRLGPGRLNATTDSDADMKYVEHGGAAVKAGVDDEERLEQAMREQSMEPFVRRTGNLTATSHAIDDAKSTTDIQAWIRATEKGLKEGYEVSARWREQDRVPPTLPDDFGVDVFSEFGLSMRMETDLAELREDRKLRVITRKRYLIERQRRGLYAADMDIEAEIEEVEEEIAQDQAGFGDEDDDTEGGDDTKPDDDNKPPDDDDEGGGDDDTKKQEEDKAA